MVILNGSRWELRPLTANEELLVAKVEAGETADFLPPPPKDDPPHSVYLLSRRPEPEIEASFLRRVLLGLPVPIKGEETPRPVRFTDSGLCVSGVTVTGILDLDDSAGEIKTRRLHFKHCWFDNDILLRRSRLKSLTVTRCAFQKLLISDADIDGLVDISFARSSAKSPQLEQCWVILAGSRIKGRINVAGSRFIAPAERSADEWVRYSRHPVYALDLRGVHVHGSIQIRPDVFAEGGVCLTLAQIEGSVWCSGAEVIAREDVAFSADYANIRGSIYMRPYEHPNAKVVADSADDSSSFFMLYTLATKRFRAEGAVSIFGATIGGSMYMSGAELVKPKSPKEPTDESCVVFDGCNAVIGGNCHFRCFRPYQPDNRIFRFKANGVMSLESARISKDLLFSGAQVEEIKASNIEIGGNCNMSVHKPCEADHLYTFRASRSVDLKGAVIRGAFDMNGAKIGDFPNSTADPDSPDITTDFLASLPFKHPEAWFADVKRPLPEVGLFASSLTVGGNCELSAVDFVLDRKTGKNAACRFQCFGQIVLREASVKNSFRMDGAMILGPSQRPAVDLSGASMGGQATFKVWCSENFEQGVHVKESLAFELVGGKRGIRLTGAKIGEKLILNGAKIHTSGVALDASNVQVGGKTTISRYGEFPFSAQGEIRFTSSSLKLELQISGASLEPPMTGGGIKARPSLDLSLAQVKVVTLKDVKSSRQILLKGTAVEANIDIQQATFSGVVNLEHVHVGTSVTLKKLQFQADSIDQRRTTCDLNQHLIRFPGIVYLSLRAARVGGELEVDEIDCLEGGKNDRIVIDLRSAHIEELNDQGGSGWGSATRLWLEGFHYKRLAEVAVGNHEWNFAEFCNRIINPSWLSHGGLNHCVDCGIWERRLRWLHAQYYDGCRPSEREFQPAAYEQVVSSWNNIGSYPEARRINSAKLSDGLAHRSFPVKVARVLFRVFFDYGLSAQRAIVTFALCIVVGWVAVCIANGNISMHGLKPALVASLDKPGSVSIDHNPAAGPNAHQVGDKLILEYTKDACGTRIEPLLYAIDVFVPVLNLRQQTACHSCAGKTRMANRPSKLRRPGVDTNATHVFDSYRNFASPYREVKPNFCYSERFIERVGHTAGTLKFAEA